MRTHDHVGVSGPAGIAWAWRGPTAISCLVRVSAAGTLGAAPVTHGERGGAEQLVDRHVAQLASAGVSAIGEVHRELASGSAC
jgi:hypothetical protein